MNINRLRELREETLNTAGFYVAVRANELQAVLEELITYQLKEKMEVEQRANEAPST